VKRCMKDALWVIRAQQREGMNDTIFTAGMRPH
jgi:hypothetical protein